MAKTRLLKRDELRLETWRDRTPQLQPGGVLRDFVSPPPAEKVQAALALIEQAQYLLNNACQCLCPVQGYCDEWEAIGELHEQVKAGWHRVEARRVGLGASHCNCLWCGKRLPDDSKDCPCEREGGA